MSIHLVLLFWESLDSLEVRKYVRTEFNLIRWNSKFLLSDEFLPQLYKRECIFFNVEVHYYVRFYLSFVLMFLSTMFKILTVFLHLISKSRLFLKNDILVRVFLFEKKYIKLNNFSKLVYSFVILSLFFLSLSMTFYVSL